MGNLKVRLGIYSILVLMLLLLNQTLFSERVDSAAPTPSSPHDQLLIPLPDTQHTSVQNTSVNDSIPLDWKGYVTIVIALLTFSALAAELMPPDIIMLSGASVFVFLGIISPKEMLQGFSRDIILTLGMLFIVARAAEVNGLLTLLAQRILPTAKHNSTRLFGMMVPLGIGSAFLNNTPLVLMLTPVIRKWASDIQESPSLFLIPLSFATILGGACTVMGTSSNLVVYGLLREYDSASSLGFFDFAYLGLPCFIIGVTYMVLVGWRLLPNRKDPARELTQETREFTSEFLVTPGCDLADISVALANQKYFSGDYLIEIERNELIIESPSPDEIIRVGDRLVLAGDIATIAGMHTIKGLQSLQDPHFHLEMSSPHFSEVVIPATSSLVGKNIKDLGFRNRYGASLLAVYRQGSRVAGRVGDVMLRAGDTLMLLSNQPWHGREFATDFLYIRHNVKLPVYAPYKAVLITVLLICMIMSVTFFGVPMMTASLATALLLFFSKMITVSEARESIRWNLLVLVASSFSFGLALVKTGVADLFASSILLVVGNNPHLLLGGLFLLTTLVTEFITNTAAALILFPIAIQAVRLAGYVSPEAMQAVGVTVALGASCSFLTPIGYQTNTIVYGPGGYRFTDYTKVGLPLNLLLVSFVTICGPLIWPLK